MPLTVAKLDVGVPEQVTPTDDPDLTVPDRTTLGSVKAGSDAPPNAVTDTEAVDELMPKHMAE
jgi:hypothetical protein